MDDQVLNELQVLESADHTKFEEARKEVVESDEQWPPVYQENHNDQQNNQDPFNNLMFGSRRAQQLSRQFPGNHPLQNPYPSQDNIDLEAMFVHIDTLIESVRGLKPLFQKVYPFIEQYIKKK